jgi:hypothetical protein
MRNLLVALDQIADDPTVQARAMPSMLRSLQRTRGYSNLQHLTRSIREVERWSAGGIYLGTAHAVDLDQGVADRFFERMAKALLRKETGTRSMTATARWSMAPTVQDLDQAPTGLKDFFLSGLVREIGGGSFRYAAYFQQQRADSLWVMQFLSGPEFMVRLIEPKGA